MNNNTRTVVILIIFVFLIIAISKNLKRKPNWTIILYGLFYGYICGLISLQLTSLLTFPDGIANGIVWTVESIIKHENDALIILISPFIELGWLFGLIMGLSYYLLLKKQIINFNRYLKNN